MRKVGISSHIPPLTKSEVRSQKSEVVFETEIYALLQKLCALKDGVLDPTIFDKSIYSSAK
ncbi:hypothetical protein CWATWH0401_1308 [Crocosphaera watsonii WH 0401]|uniref:Uncharacterized protein n=1 Tax=Crocosphaera watsonii WH 0401 TaxID=555881 RepID=T2J1G4_CROWT|nr:hypothetical protein CWATWH0401_1308 [Crocosphaera watsonii WH 0401]